MRIPLVGPTYQHPSLNVSAQRCVNLFVESTQGLTADDINYILRRTPGTQLFSTVADGGVCRQLYVASNGRLFGVFNEKLFEIFQAGTSILRGSLNSYSGIVKMADNGDAVSGAGGDQLILVDGTDGYIFNFNTEAFVQITSGGFPTEPSTVVYMNTLFLVNHAQTNQFYFSSPLDGLTWDALDFYSAETSPDPINQMAQNNGQLWLFGPNSFEVQYITGNPDQLFALYPGSYNSTGLLAPNSVAEANNNLFFLGGNKDGFSKIYKTDGYSAKSISNIPIEAAISGYRTPDDAIGFTYQKDGHYFYIITFQGGNATWVYDLTTDMWHERESLYGNDPGRWSCIFHAFAFNQNVVADLSRSNLYTLESNVYVERSGETDEAGITCIRISPQSNDPDYFNRIYRSLEIQIQSGVGLTTGQGSDPQMILDWSDDGGHNWSNQLSSSMGKIGEYQYRVRWLRLGKSRLRCWRITVSDPVDIVIISAAAQAERCAS